MLLLYFRSSLVRLELGLGQVGPRQVPVGPRLGQVGLSSQTLVSVYLVQVHLYTSTTYLVLYKRAISFYLRITDKSCVCVCVFVFVCVISKNFIFTDAFSL